MPMGLMAYYITCNPVFECKFYILYNMLMSLMAYYIYKCLISSAGHKFMQNMAQ